MARFALIDGNSFYASCQMVFDPSLKDRPVVVLSNNDGCIVAANAQAKALDNHLPADFGKQGYAGARSNSIMYQPFFKVREALTQRQAAVFSSNYELYGDMSQRMHAIVGQFSPHQEIYSIDESFLDLSGMGETSLEDYGRQIQQRVRQWIGIPVAVGIASSKTLAKLANHWAKKNAVFAGVLDISQWDDATLAHWMQNTSISKVWGIGQALEKNLAQLKMHSVWDLYQANPQHLRRRFSVVVERIYWELHGVSCLPLSLLPADKQQIISSRSFGQAVTHKPAMRQAVATYTARAAEKLRKQNSQAGLLSLWISTNPFQAQQPQYRRYATMAFIYPSDNTSLLIKIALRLLDRIWLEGYAYHKASITLAEITPKGMVQGDLWAGPSPYVHNPKADKIMQIMDKVNQLYGRGSLQLAAQGMAQTGQWSMQRNLMSPRYTTRWNELPCVKA